MEAGGWRVSVRTSSSVANSARSASRRGAVREKEPRDVPTFSTSGGR